MFRSILIFLFITMATLLIAIPDFYPKTILTEDFSSAGCSACEDADLGIDVLHSTMHSGELISARYYINSVDLSNADTAARFQFYNGAMYPTVIFDGMTVITGGGVNITNGTTYLNAIRQRQYAASPVKMNVTNFNPVSGQISVRVTMLSSTFTLTGDSIRFILMENDVTSTATRVVRAVLSQPITLSGANNYLDFNAAFNISTAWNTTNLWAAAFVQLTDNNIVQTASTLTQPQYQIRAMMPFHPIIEGIAPNNYNSPTIYFYNTGLTEDYTIKLIKDDGPDDWYMNYCSETGECYPGWSPHPFSLAAGDTIGFHLNLDIGSTGVANFHFIVESPNMTPYIVNFTYYTPGSAEEQILPVADYTFMQNYPNPFIEDTNLRILSNKAHDMVGVDIFNVKGQRVKTLHHVYLTKGLNEIQCNRTDDFEKELPQGIYFARIRGLENTKPGKMLILNK